MSPIALLDSAPARRLLPWRYRESLKKSREERLRRTCDELVRRTRPLETGRDALHFEIHMLLGQKHVGMALWAVKSFLHVCNRRFTVVLHEDGSLAEADAALLRAHLPGVRVVSKSVADAEMDAWLKPFPNCHDYRFAEKKHSDHRNTAYNMHIFAVRLFDFNRYTNATKRMFLDADILFFRRPDEILQWIDREDDWRLLYSVEAFLPGHDWLGRWTFATKEPTFNAGLICLHGPSAYDLTTLDGWIGENRHRMDLAPTFEQSAYRYLSTRAPGLSAPLSAAYPFNYTDPSVVATHFGIKVRFFENAPRLLAELS